MIFWFEEKSSYTFILVFLGVEAQPAVTLNLDGHLEGSGTPKAADCFQTFGRFLPNCQLIGQVEFVFVQSSDYYCNL